MSPSLWISPRDVTKFINITSGCNYVYEYHLEMSLCQWISPRVVTMSMNVASGCHYVYKYRLGRSLCLWISPRVVTMPMIVTSGHRCVPEYQLGKVTVSMNITSWRHKYELQELQLWRVTTEKSYNCEELQLSGLQLRRVLFLLLLICYKKLKLNMQNCVLLILEMRISRKESSSFLVYLLKHNFCRYRVLPGLGGILYDSSSKEKEW